VFHYSIPEYILIYYHCTQYLAKRQPQGDDKFLDLYFINAFTRYKELLNKI